MLSIVPLLFAHAAGNLASGTYSWPSPSPPGAPPSPPRTFHVNVPAQDSGTARDAVFLFHHRGGDALGVMNNWLQRVAGDYVTVSVQGVANSWNVVAEPSREDDVALVEQLVEHVLSFANVGPRAVLYGASNGAAFVNRLLIECDDPRIVAAITDSSQLNARQYRGGSFYVGGGQNAYTEARSLPLVPRHLLQLVSTTDPIIPYLGGESRIGDPAGPNGKLVMVPYDVSVEAYRDSFARTARVLYEHVGNAFYAGTGANANATTVFVDHAEITAPFDLHIVRNWNGVNDTIASFLRMALDGGPCTGGDVNADGAVNVADVVRTVLLITGTSSTNGVETCAADANADARVDVLDAVRIVGIILDAS